MISITRTNAIMIGNSTVDPEDDPVAGDVAVVVGAVVRGAIPTVVDLVGG
jgi:citrate lyase alpha subunit